jgi:hypothetical protein
LNNDREEGEEGKEEEEEEEGRSTGYCQAILSVGTND